MNISLDFDRTYTLDPEFWNNFILSCERRGHTVYCVTLRHEFESGPVYKTIGKLIDHDRIIFCGQRAKLDICESQGIYIDVWIDDMPWYIAEDEVA